MGRACLRQEQKLSNVEEKRKELRAFVGSLEDPAAKKYFSDLFAMAYGRILSSGKLNWEQYNFLMTLSECVEHCVPKTSRRTT